MLRLNPTYFKNILEELNYPQWIIKKKMTEMKKVYSVYQWEALFVLRSKLNKYKYEKNKNK